MSVIYQLEETKNNKITLTKTYSGGNFSIYIENSGDYSNFLLRKDQALEMANSIINSFNNENRKN